MYNDLKSGRMEVAADSFGSATYANEQNGSPWQVEVPEPDERGELSQERPQPCFPMGKSNEALYETVSEDLETLRADGTIAEILEKHCLDPSAADVGQLNLID